MAGNWTGEDVVTREAMEEDLREQVRKNQRLARENHQLRDELRKAEHTEEVLSQALMRVSRGVRDHEWPTVYVVITPGPGGEIIDLEVLDGPPQWNLTRPTDNGPGGQVCYVANVNGGDSIQWYMPHWPGNDPNDTDQCPVPNCTTCGMIEARKEREDRSSQ
jgi:hypothetical protein